MVMCTVVNLQCNYLSQQHNVILHHMGPAGVWGQMEWVVGGLAILSVQHNPRGKMEWKPMVEKYPEGN